MRKIQNQRPGIQNQKEETGNKQRETPRKEDNVILVGKKPPMSYVLAVVTSFDKGFPEVTIKARGNVISSAVDVEEIVRHRFLPGVKIKTVRLMTEELTNRDGRLSKVSAIEIVLMK